MESGVKASEKAYETFRGFLEPDVQKSIDDQIAGMKQDTSLSLQDKALFWDQAKGMMGGAINQKFALDKQQRELNAAAARQRESLDQQAMAPYRQQAASLLATPMVGTDFGAGQGFSAPPFSAPPKRQRTDFFGNFVN